MKVAIIDSLEFIKGVIQNNLWSFEKCKKIIHLSVKNLEGLNEIPLIVRKVEFINKTRYTDDEIKLILKDTCEDVESYIPMEDITVNTVFENKDLNAFLYLVFKEEHGKTKIENGIIFKITGISEEKDDRLNILKISNND